MDPINNFYYIIGGVLIVSMTENNYYFFKDQHTDKDIVNCILKKIEDENGIVIEKKSAFNKDFETEPTNIKMDGVASVGSLNTIARGDHVHPTDTSRAAVTHNHDNIYETPDAAQEKVNIHANQPNPHSGHISHSLATAPNDFLVASGKDQFVKKTVSEVKEILGIGTAEYTASDVLEKLKTVDGSTSGLDADLLDGKEAIEFATAEQGIKADNALPATFYTASDVLEKVKTLAGSGSKLDADLLDGKEATEFATAEQGIKADNALPATAYSASDVLEKVKTLDGSGSKLDADLLDGKEATEFATAEQGIKADNALPATSYTASDVLDKVKTLAGSGSKLDADLLDGKEATDFATAEQGIKADNALPATVYSASDVLEKVKTLDGSGSKLDADLLDGKEATDFATAEQGIKADNAATQVSLDTHISDTIFQTADGTATAITLTISSKLINGFPITFIAAISNNGAATTINSKPLYKPNTTTAPTLVKGKAYTVWYNSTNNCFFIKASTEGDAVAANVLAGKTFSNDNNTGLVGTIPTKDAATYTPSASVQTIAAGQYLNGTQTINAVTVPVANVLSGTTIAGQAGTMANNGAKIITPSTNNQAIPLGYHDGKGYVAGDANLISSNIAAGKSIFGVTGTLSAGKKWAKGIVAEGESTVSGLPFTPSVVITYDTSNGFLLYSSYLGVNHMNYIAVFNGGFICPYNAPGGLKWEAYE